MRVVVTGLGLVTPLGVGMKRSWPRILSGDSGIRSTKELSSSFDNLPSRVAAWVAEAEVAQALENAVATLLWERTYHLIVQNRREESENYLNTLNML